MIAISNTQQVKLTLIGLNADGQPSQNFGGVPAWTLDNPALGTLTPAADSFSANFVALAGPAGIATVTCAVNGLTDTMLINVANGNSGVVTLVYLVAGQPTASSGQSTANPVR